MDDFEVSVPQGIKFNFDAESFHLLHFVHDKGLRHHGKSRDDVADFWFARSLSGLRSREHQSFLRLKRGLQNSVEATRQDFPLFSVPPSVQLDAPSQEAQAKDRRRGARHDDRAVQTERIQGTQIVWPAERCESKANTLFAKDRDNRVIVIAIRIAEDWQADADFSLQIFLRTLDLLADLFERRLRHDGVCSRVRSECQHLPREVAKPVPGEDLASLCEAEPKF